MASVVKWNPSLHWYVASVLNKNLSVPWNTVRFCEKLTVRFAPRLGFSQVVAENREMQAKYPS
jgi:hypothetical protein